MNGIKHDKGKPELHLLPTISLEEVAYVMSFGKSKYGEYNWMGGIQLSRLLSASLRHIFKHLSGKTHDPESGRYHLAHAACNILMAIWMLKKRADLDDRQYIEENELEVLTSPKECGTIVDVDRKSGAV